MAVLIRQSARSAPWPSRAAGALALGRAASALSRALRLGDGTTVGGRVALRLDPGLLARLAHGRETVLVSGTNGKTTTTRMIAEAWRTRAPVVTNTSGANLPAGHVMALAGEPAARHCVLEVDEGYLGAVVAATRPRAVVLLNLTRDQLDRVNEVRRLAAKWRKVLRGLPPETTVVANADDPLIVWAAGEAPRIAWVAAGQPWDMDAALCPGCGSLIHHGDAGWRCTGCGLKRPDPYYALEGDRVRLPDGRAQPLALRLPGRANRANSVFAIAAAQVVDVPPDQALPALARIDAVAGRYATVDLGGRRLRLLLAKNPAGWLETLQLLEAATGPVVIGVNARAADGRDTSWLWDVPFERLRGRYALAIGERRIDLAVRLEHAGLHCAVLDRFGVDDLDAALRTLPDRDRKVDCALNYTAFHQLLRHVHANA